jgi:hypothetical protein
MQLRPLPRRRLLPTMQAQNPQIAPQPRSPILAQMARRPRSLRDKGKRKKSDQTANLLSMRNPRRRSLGSLESPRIRLRVTSQHLRARRSRQKRNLARLRKMQLLNLVSLPSLKWLVHSHSHHNLHRLPYQHLPNFELQTT